MYVGAKLMVVKLNLTELGIVTLPNSFPFGYLYQISLWMLAKPEVSFLLPVHTEQLLEVYGYHSISPRDHTLRRKLISFQTSL